MIINKSQIKDHIYMICKSCGSTEFEINFGPGYLDNDLDTSYLIFKCSDCKVDISIKN
jgi:hypothetical protein